MDLGVHEIESHKADWRTIRVVPIVTMTDPASIGIGVVGVVGSVVQIYNAVMSTYNLYLEVGDVPSEYKDLRMGLLLEHERLKLWGDHVLAEYKDERSLYSIPENHIATWKMMEWIFGRIKEAFIENNQILEKMGQQIGLPSQGDAPGICVSAFG